MDLTTVHNSPGDVAEKAHRVGAAILRQSANVRAPNFERLSADDVQLLFHLYDEEFFGGGLGPWAEKQTGRPIAFRVSSRMTRAGGRTTVRTQRRHGRRVRRAYEIAISERLLLLSFSTIDRPIVVCGLVCGDRLAALQRVMEHEIIHLGEFIQFGKSSCSADRFRGLAGDIFAHTNTKHAMVTPAEQARVEHDIAVGGQVEFDFRGRRMVGRVNRVTRRVTVLVEDSDGVLFSDGGRYQKYYVPLENCRPVAG